MNRQHWPLLLTVCALAALMPAPVLADAIMPPPKTFSCPRGHSVGTDHGGAYCQPPLPKCQEGYKPRVVRARAYCEPPPPKCKEGHRPRVIGDDAYCEAPPAVPCPAGSFWTSNSRTDAYCLGGRRCYPPDYACYPKDTTCRMTSLCVYRETINRGFFNEVVRGTCKTDEDCEGIKDQFGRRFSCEKARRCDPKVKRSAKPASQPASKVEPDNKAAPPARNTTPPPPAAKSGGCAGCAVTATSGSCPLLLLLVLVQLRRRHHHQ